MIPDRRRAGAAIAATLAALAATAHAAPPPAITADSLVLIVNKQQPAGRALAEEYARLRGVPDGRIVEVDCRDADEIERPFYERSIAEVVRREIASRGLRGKVQCAVLFYGLPLRVREAKRTLPEIGELSNVLMPAEKALTDYLAAIATRVEATATRVAPAFKPAAGGVGAEGLRVRLAAAEGAIVAALSDVADPAAREAARGDVVAARRDLSTLPPLPMLPAAASSVPKSPADIDALVLRRDDADSRRRVREVMLGGRDAFQLLTFIEAQRSYLATTEAESSVDSELSCLWLATYPLTKWLANPWHYASPAVALRGQVLRTCRIDGPTEAIARRTFNDAVVAERRGLEGDAVFDARGLHKPGPYGGFDFYDGTIRRAADLATGAAGLSVLRDDAEPLMPDGTSARAALYCGWYKVREYHKTVAMLPGAIAFHVASYELLTLRTPGEAGWVRGLMLDGADATMGSVAEPYLLAFPPADEFFGLLMTGRASLAEAYWATNPVTSWRMVLIGDPLYRPFAARPAIDVEKLPAALRAAIE